MRRSICLLCLTLPLAACGSGGPTVSATNASAADVQAKIAAAGGDGQMVKPGRWEGTMKIDDMKMPLLPPDQQAKIGDKLGKENKIVSCVTPEEVKANKAFFTGNDDKSCKYDHFTLGGGKLDAAMACGEADSKMTGTMVGTYSSDRYTMTVTSDTTGPKNQPYATMSTKMTVDMKRVGECRGTEDKE